MEHIWPPQTPNEIYDPLPQGLFILKHPPPHSQYIINIRTLNGEPRDAEQLPEWGNF